jgi:hypothetical protein
LQLRFRGTAGPNECNAAIYTATCDPWSSRSRVPLPFVAARVVIVTRLYLRALGSGRPDLIENAVVGATEGRELWANKLPWMILTHQFEKEED